VGRLEGKLNGEDLPEGADWQIITATGVAQLEARTPAQVLLDFYDVL